MRVCKKWLEKNYLVFLLGLDVVEAHIVDDLLGDLAEEVAGEAVLLVEGVVAEGDKGDVGPAGLGAGRVDQGQTGEGASGAVKLAG